MTTRRAQVVEMRKRLLAQIRAHRKSGTAELFEDIDVELKERLDVAITELESRISELLGRYRHLADTARILRSVPGIGPVASSTLITELPELGALTGEEAAALTGLAPVAQDRRTACHLAKSTSMELDPACRCARSSRPADDWALAVPLLSWIR
ncbi:transposase [Hyphomonas sp.]|uniref:transposase n=2 Tax=Hyphomonas sp. TaxID=87 RepID=UPI003517BA75